MKANAPEFPEMSIETRMMIDRLSQMTPGETITYDELTRLIERDVTKKGRCNLTAAMRKCRDWHKLAIVTVRNVGVKCLYSREISGAMTSQFQRIGRAARRTQKTATCAKVEELTPDERMTYFAARSIAGALEFTARKHTFKQVERRSESGMVPSAAVFDAITKG